MSLVVGSTSFKGKWVPLVGKKKPKKLSIEEKNAIIAVKDEADRFHWGCFYCGDENIDRFNKKNGHKFMTADHVNPFNRGNGATEKSNLVMACDKCNSDIKGCMSLGTFISKNPEIKGFIDRYLVRAQKDDPEYGKAMAENVASQTRDIFLSK